MKCKYTVVYKSEGANQTMTCWFLRLRHQAQKWNALEGFLGISFGQLEKCKENKGSGKSWLISMALSKTAMEKNTTSSYPKCLTWAARKIVLTYNSTSKT